MTLRPAILEGKYCLHLQSSIGPTDLLTLEDGGGTFLRNLGIRLLCGAASYPKRVEFLGTHRCKNLKTLREFLGYPTGYCRVTTDFGLHI
jgi:hypothetical protein